MKSIGFVISTKENEKRRAVLPYQLSSVKNIKQLYFEKGYGEILGISDQQYLDVGANIVEKDIVLKQDIICDPKIGDANYIEQLAENQIVFGWIHAVQNRVLTDLLLKKKLTVIAWEDMFEKGRHVFWKNNELAGEAAILHAFPLYGKIPHETDVAIIGKGNTSHGAYKALISLGANAVIYDRKTINLLPDELENYHVIVNCILWDITRTDHIIYKNDISRLKKPSAIIDISCDRAGAIETSIPTTIQNPFYYINNVFHYVVDHTPALFPYTVTKYLGDEVIKYLDFMIENRPSIILKDATIIDRGIILDDKIIKHQHR